MENVAAVASAAPPPLAHAAHPALSSANDVTPPLLLLLDGTLSQDAVRVDAALRQLSLFAMRNHELSPSSPLNIPWLTGADLLASPPALYRLLESLLRLFPGLAGHASGHDGSLPLHFAASLGDVNVARLLYERFPAAASTPNAKGKIPLHYAAREGRFEMVQYLLLQHPGTAQMASHKFKLALHFAAGEGHLEVCRLLLHYYPRGAALPSAKGKIALHFCARWGHVALARELLRCYPDGVRALDWEGSLPLHDAARQGQIEVSRLLLDRFPGAASVANLRNELPLFPAVRSGNLELVALLLQAWPSGGKSVLQNVSADDNLDEWTWDILELLLRGAVGAPLELVERENTTRDDRETDRSESDTARFPLSQKSYQVAAAAAAAAASAISTNQQSQLLVPPNENPPVSTDDAGPSTSGHSPPLCLADSDESSTNRKRPAVDFSSLSSASFNQGSTSGGDAKRWKVNDSDGSQPSPLSEAPVPHPSRRLLPLHAALQCGASVPVLKRVLQERQADVSLVDDSGRTPLHWAVCRTQELNVVQVGKSLKSKKKKPKTPVCNRVDLDLIRPLVSPEAARTRDAHNCLPLHLALQHQVALPILDCLLEAHPLAAGLPCGDMIPAEVECSRFRPFHLACQYDCDTSVIFRLLRLDPSVLEGGRSLS